MQELSTAEAYNANGMSLFHLGKYEEAIEAFEEAIHMDETCSLAYFNQSRALFALGKYEAALEVNDKALELNPNCALALSQRIMFYLL